MASAMRFSTGSTSPFDKVKALIIDMLRKLERDAAADVSQKQYCDKQLSESAVKKDDKTKYIDKLSNKIDQMTSRSAQLKEQIASLQGALANLARSQIEMDKMRHQEHEEFLAVKANLEKGLDGVRQ